MIVWPAVYTGGALVAAGLLCSDFAGRRGLFGDALRLLPGLALLAVGVAARLSGLLTNEPGLASAWAEVMARADVGTALIWGVAASVLPPLAPATAAGQLARGLVSGGFRPAARADEPRTLAETAGAALSPLVLLSMVFVAGPWRAVLPLVSVAGLVALVVANRGAWKPAGSTSPVERAAIGAAAVGLAHLGGAFAQLDLQRTSASVVLAVALAAGLACDPLVAALAVARALPVAPSLSPWVVWAALGLWVGRAAFVVARSALSRRQ